MLLKHLAFRLTVAFAKQVSVTFTRMMLKNLAINWLTVVLAEQVSGTIMGCCRSGWVGGQ